MHYINCCNKRRICDLYELQNLSGVVRTYAFYLEACPVCGHSALVLRRILADGSVNEFRKKNDKARKLFAKIRPFILSKILPFRLEGGSSYFLHYLEFGQVKKCYSNLSSLTLGKFENSDLPIIPKKLPLPAVCR